MTCSIIWPIRSRSTGVLDPSLRCLQARDDLTDVMCKKEMGVYTAIFGTTGDTAALERTDRRYLWLRKRLGSRQEVQPCAV